MDQYIHQVVSGEGDEAQAATAAVLSALRQGSLGVLGLVSADPQPETSKDYCWFCEGI
jgi:hypothetical protein